MGTIEILTGSSFSVRKNEWKTLWSGMVLLWMMVLAGCNPKPAPSFEGTFVNAASSEFSEAFDTLRVEKVGELDYLIYRSTGIVIIDEQGKKAKPVIQRESWKLQFDQERKLLLERSKGRELKMLDDALVLEKAVYQRLH
ncbi:hypothetical protein [Pedobacter xixiisoli]|uniref:Uncharacterized protein n=1 Tax=Pedobacter xixiisoli TaxID=1476464 RepID=A0A285ZW80_9SPHI|nr:hypothetical protein [Pedobacter xixiisoli]SOD13886.1 hypothetical protein SAMN06297358_1292 [Pedobacter xixiisoli]